MSEKEEKPEKDSDPMIYLVLGVLLLSLLLFGDLKKDRDKLEADHDKVVKDALRLDFEGKKVSEKIQILKHEVEDLKYRLKVLEKQVVYEIPRQEIVASMTLFHEIANASGVYTGK